MKNRKIPGLNIRKRDQRAKYTERNRPVFWRPIGECMEPRPQQQKPSPDKQKKTTTTNTTSIATMELDRLAQFTELMTLDEMGNTQRNLINK